MQVRNIAVKNKYLAMDTFIKNLIDWNIRYLRVENEIHFCNQICRFFDMNEIRERRLEHPEEKEMFYELISNFEDLLVAYDIVDEEKKVPLDYLNVAEPYHYIKKRNKEKKS